MTKPTRMAKESEILNVCIEYLFSLGGLFWRNNNGAVYDPIRKTFRTLPRGCIKGIPDILGVYLGVPVAIEVKTPKTINLKTDTIMNQIAFIKRFNECGGKATMVSSLDECVAFIKEIENDSTRVGRK